MYECSQSDGSLSHQWPRYIDRVGCSRTGIAVFWNRYIGYFCILDSRFLAAVHGPGKSGDDPCSIAITLFFIDISFQLLRGVHDLEYKGLSHPSKFAGITDLQGVFYPAHRIHLLQSSGIVRLGELLWPLNDSFEPQLLHNPSILRHWGESSVHHRWRIRWHAGLDDIFDLTISLVHVSPFGL